MQTKKLLGLRIREVRHSRQLTQEKLSEMIGLDPKQISRIESGQSYPSMDTLEAIADHLDVEMQDLLNFRHLSQAESLDEEVLRILRQMDLNTKRLSIKILNALIA